MELTLHVDEIMEQAKESMAQDAIAIRMQTKDFIDKRQSLLADAHARCEEALVVAHTRMRDVSREYNVAYEEALDKHLQTVLESTITEVTLNQEMIHASQAHRESIEKMTAIAPLVLNDDNHQLQIKCAAAEEKADELQRELRILKRGDPAGQVVVLRKELDDLREKLAAAEEKIVKRSASVLSENLMESQDENRYLRSVNKNITDVVVVDLKKRLETAEGKLENLKRKRADSNSPEGSITAILKRPALHSPSGQLASRKYAPSSSAQPTPKKSRNRRSN